MLTEIYTNDVYFFVAKSNSLLKTHSVTVSLQNREADLEGRGGGGGGSILSGFSEVHM